MSDPSDVVEDPFTYLEQDHKEMAAIMKQLEDTTERAEKTRTELFEKLNRMLSLHMEVEERIVYPELRALKKTHEITVEGVEEHHVAKLLLRELTEGSPTRESWGAKFKVLKENIDHHVEEEETDMFVKARKALSDEHKATIAENMENFLRSAAA